MESWHTPKHLPVYETGGVIDYLQIIGCLPNNSALYCRTGMSVRTPFSPALLSYGRFRQAAVSGAGYVQG
jgi:hypothetical protein